MPDPRMKNEPDVGVGAQLPRRYAIFHCERCPRAARKLVQNVDYVPAELLCVRCGNRVKPIFKVVK
jgi:hypothetical protein